MRISKRLLPLFAALLLAGCAAKQDASVIQQGGADAPAATTVQTAPGEDTPQEQPGVPATTGVPAESGETAVSGGETTPPSGGNKTPGSSGGSGRPTATKPTNPVAPTEAPPGAIMLDGLRFDSFGRYSGAFVEDGSDRPVENVACVLAVNTTGRYLDLATAVFEIDGVEARFTVTGLPPNAAAWVLESTALEVEGGAEFVLKGGSASYSVLDAETRITAAPDVGFVNVQNTGEEPFSGYIYYKVVHSDGNFLGGITYRSYVDSLAAQSITQINAGHCTEDSAIVRIMYAESPG